MLPAYAGMILNIIDPKRVTACAPRIRGDDPGFQAILTT